MSFQPRLNAALRRVVPAVLLHFAVSVDAGRLLVGTTARVVVWRIVGLRMRAPLDVGGLTENADGHALGDVIHVDVPSKLTYLHAHPRHVLRDELLERLRVARVIIEETLGGVSEVLGC